MNATKCVLAGNFRVCVAHRIITTQIIVRSEFRILSSNLNRGNKKQKNIPGSPLPDRIMEDLQLTSSVCKRYEKRPRLLLIVIGLIADELNEARNS